MTIDKNSSSYVAPAQASEQRAKLETRAVFVRCEYCGGMGEPYDGVSCAECDGFGTMEVEGEPITLDDLDSNREKEIHCVLCEAGVGTFDAHGTIYHRAKRRITDEYIECPQTSPTIAALKDGERILREDIDAQANTIQQLRDERAEFMKLCADKNNSSDVGTKKETP